jgi:hypothetical protein
MAKAKLPTPEEFAEARKQHYKERRAQYKASGMVGRPLDLTPTLQSMICRMIEAGIPLKYAAGANGISDKLVYQWLSRGRAGETPYADFLEATQLAASKFAAMEYVKLGKDIDASGNPAARMSRMTRQGLMQSEESVITHRNGGEVPANEDVDIDFDKMSVKEVEAFVKELDAALSKAPKTIEGQVTGRG